MNIRLQLSGSGIDTESAKEGFAFRFESWVEFNDRLGSEVLGDELALLPPAFAIWEADERGRPIHPGQSLVSADVTERPSTTHISKKTRRGRSELFAPRFSSSSRAAIAEFRMTMGLPNAWTKTISPDNGYHHQFLLEPKCARAYAPNFLPHSANVFH